MASRFFVNGGGTLDWNLIANWSATSNGAGGQTVPTSSDAVTLDQFSPNCTVPSSGVAQACASLTCTNYTNTLTINKQLSVSGSIRWGTGMTLASTASTEKLRMIAAGTWTSGGKTCANDIEIGGTTTFTCTLADNLTTSGTLFLTNTTSTIFSGNFVINANHCTISGSQTITISGNVQIDGTTTSSDANVINGAFNWKTNNLLTTGNITGTTTFVFQGTGTWTGAAGSLANNCNIDAGGSTLQLVGTVLYTTGTITWVSGTVTGGTLSLGASCTLATAGMSWANITITAAATITINSLLTVTGTLTLPNAAVTFAGTAGFTVGTLTCTTASATRAFAFGAGLTYTITSSFVLSHAAAPTVRYTITGNATKPFITLNIGATQDIGFADPTNIDSSKGQLIFSYDGVITTSPGWTNTYGAPIYHGAAMTGGIAA